MSVAKEYEFFTEDWLRAWVGEIDRSDSYRQAAATWEGSLIFRLSTSNSKSAESVLAGGMTAVFLDLWHGECREARFASSQDQEEADYMLEADLAMWKGLLAGKTQPLMALMTGKLKLVRGSLSSLMPYVQASQELVAAASRVHTVFPDN